MAESAKARHKRAPQTGRTLSEETKKKLSEKKKAYYARVSEEQRKADANWSEERRKAQSELMKKRDGLFGR